MDNCQIEQTEKGCKKCMKVDARIIFLNSSDISSAMMTSSEGSNNPCSFFSYCDKIDIASVNDKGQPMLKSSYEHAIELLNTKKNSEKNNQFILAFTNVIDESCDKRIWGYTENEINAFWGSKNSSLLFLTMVNLTGADEIESCLEKIKRDFDGEDYITYLTYDHCDIIIFCYGNSFKNYSEKISRFAYIGEHIPAGVITLHSFNLPLDKIGGKSEEEFHALLRMGVNDYRKADEFYKEIKMIDQNVQMRRFFERNDCGYYMSNATVKHIVDIMEKMKKISQDSWYSNYELLISVESISIKEQINFIKRRQYRALRQKMSKNYDNFYKKYNEIVKELEMSPDTVWLRWLYNSSNLAVSLMEDYLSEDFGTCLVSHFLDLFEYGIKFLDAVKKYNCFENEQTEKRDTIEAISRSFSTFFLYTAVLIDSMNQSNRQFVQIPPFHLPSFVVPPKIMEYYIAVAHKLIDLFHDDQNNSYCLLMAPQFINKLGAQSIADQETLKNDQWIEIIISEPSFYTLQLTTQILGHEISHFVGQNNRCRPKRKECAIKFAYCTLILLILDDIPARVGTFFRFPNNKMCIATAEFSPDKISQTADLMYCEALKFFKDYDSEDDNLLISLQNLISTLAERILNYPSLYNILFKLLYDYAKKDLSSSGSSAMINVAEYLKLHQKWMLNAVDQENILNEDAFFNHLAKEKFDLIVKNILTTYSIECYDGNYMIQLSPESNFNTLEAYYLQALDYFKETFADLQAIMVFEMNWTQYCGLIKREGEARPVADCPLRMLAVTKVLVKNGLWKEDDVINANNPGFENVEQALTLDPEKNTCELKELGLNSTLLFYLIEYLGKCSEEISQRLKEPHSFELRNELKKMHDLLSNENVLETQKEIGKFVCDFRKKLVED